MTGTIEKALGRRIRARRQMLGLSLKEVGRRIGRSHQAVQKYELATNSMYATTAVALAAALEWKPSDLLDGLAA